MALVLVFFANAFLSAQEKKEKREVLNEVVISATKFEEKKENTNKVIYQITQADIQKNQGSTVIELLNRVPGVEIRGLNSNPTEPRGLFVRGGRGRQVLVLIDGVPVSDPSGINQEFDLRYLSLNQIEKIEFLKGASSTLYGTGAATGVINIILKKAKKDSFGFSFDTSVGTNNSVQNSSSNLNDRNLNSSVSFKEGDFSLLTSVNLQSTTGQSAALSNSTTVFEEDPFYSENILVKLGYKISDKVSISGFYNYDSFEFNYDSGTFADSEANSGDQTQNRFGLSSNFIYKGGLLKALFSINTVKRNLVSGGESSFKGTSKNIDIINKVKLFTNEFHLITGINYQEHDNDTATPFGTIDNNVANFSTFDPYASVAYTSDFGFNANVGGRLNNHSEYGSHFVYDVSVAQKLFKSNADFDLKLISSYSSAFIAPSTYQLFSAFGNLDLEPETSTTFEFGFDSKLNKNISLNAVYFNRKEDTAIIFASLNAPPYGQYQNAASNIKVDGIETELRYDFNKELNFYANYTYTNKNEEADYIPANKWLATVEYSPAVNFNATLTYRNVGERVGRYFDNATSTVAVETIDAYSLVDISANYSFLKNKVTLYGQITNLFNEDFQDIIGFTTRGRNYRLGLRYNF